MRNTYCVLREQIWLRSTQYAALPGSDMARRTKRWTRTELIAMLDDLWAKYPDRLAALPEDEQARFAQQQGYDRPQDLIAHLGAWMAETLRVMPYLLRDERQPRDYANDEQFNRRAVERFQDKERAQVEAWYQKQRRALRKLIKQLPDDALSFPRVYRWLAGTIVGHYEEHPLPASRRQKHAASSTLSPLC